MDVPHRVWGNLQTVQCGVTKPTGAKKNKVNTATSGGSILSSYLISRSNVARTRICTAWGDKARDEQRDTNKPMTVGHCDRAGLAGQRLPIVSGMAAGCDGRRGSGKTRHVPRRVIRTLTGDDDHVQPVRAMMM
ncbi:hypothetical protein L210DRAFT_3633198 [Boletus edulis BED1]|uniref:WRKY domain-containing protein n=1 Tax=Boletus edulis BED1 TaxID=1328754 RepID=A0AAD4BKR8_BOLED|nr:hypothetical protein L210DRAFT_3633198 [Boletus edulis BED1]